VSSIMAIVLKSLVAALHVTLGEGFLIFGGMASSTAFVMLFTVPRQQEFFDRAAVATGEEQTPPKRNMLLLIGDVIDVFMQRKRDNGIFFLYILFINFTFALWLGQMYPYLLALYGNTKNPGRIEFFVNFSAYMTMSGMILTPTMGWIMDKVGYTKFFTTYDVQRRPLAPVSECPSLSRPVCKPCNWKPCNSLMVNILKSVGGVFYSTGSTRYRKRSNFLHPGCNYSSYQHRNSLAIDGAPWQRVIFYIQTAFFNLGSSLSSRRNYVIHAPAL